MLENKSIPSKKRHPLHRSKLFTKAEIAQYDAFYLSTDLPFSQATYYANVILEKEKMNLEKEDTKSNAQKGVIPQQGKLKLGSFSRTNKKVKKRKFMSIHREGITIEPVNTSNLTKSVVDTEEVQVIKPEDNIVDSAIQ